jgi:hypothetical protein
MEFLGPNNQAPGAGEALTKLVRPRIRKARA